jgi:hypothetical protein
LTDRAARCLLRHGGRPLNTASPEALKTGRRLPLICGFYASVLSAVKRRLSGEGEARRGVRSGDGGRLGGQVDYPHVVIAGFAIDNLDGSHGHDHLHVLPDAAAVHAAELFEHARVHADGGQLLELGLGLGQARPHGGLVVLVTHFGFPVEHGPEEINGHGGKLSGSPGRCKGSKRTFIHDSEFFSI